MLPLKPEIPGKGGKDINRDIYRKVILKVKWYKLEVNGVN